MASNLRVDTILPSSGTNVAIGTASGTVSLVGNSNLTTTGNLTIGGNLGIGGTLTYEDVTNIDSVGIITARNGINISSGSLTIPDSIIHSGDTNTKIRFPAVDTITAETSGSERLRITSAGLVGIGTDTPYNPLAVVGSSADIMVYDTDDYSQNVSGGAVAFAGKDSAGNRKTLADVRGVANGANIGEFAIRTRRTGGTLTEALRIDSSGNVGINSSVIQRAYKTYNTPGYRYHSRADGMIIRHGGSGTNFTITGMNQGFASLRIGAYSEGQRVNFHADIGGYNAGDAGVRLYDSNEITNQATSYGSGSCSITVTKNNASYVVNVTQTNSPGGGMAGFYFFETGGYNSVSTLTIADT